MLGREISELSEQILMILPDPRRSIPPTTARDTRNALVRFTSITCRKNSSVIESRGWRATRSPALFTRMSTASKRAVTFSTMASTSADFVRSAWNEAASVPAALSAVTTSSAPSRLFM